MQHLLQARGRGRVLHLLERRGLPRRLQMLPGDEDLVDGGRGRWFVRAGARARGHLRQVQDDVGGADVGDGVVVGGVHRDAGGARRRDGRSRFRRRRRSVQHFNSRLLQKYN